jgi:CubicO group peptidase (beta-lactamase class C family)
MIAAAAAAFAQTAYPGAADIDRVINESVAKGEIPGAVLQIGKPGQVLYRKAYGSRALTPVKEAMTEDTVFDIASLTKVIATTSAMMKLFDQGKVRLNDPVSNYLPAFGKNEITLRLLMTHFSVSAPTST